MTVNCPMCRIVKNSQPRTSTAYIQEMIATIRLAGLYL